VKDHDREVVEQELRRRAKQAIRKKMRGVRAALPESARAARSTKLIDRVFELDAYQQAGVVLAFASLEHEVDTGRLVDAVRATKKRLVLPRVTDNQLTLHEVFDDTKLQPGSFSVPEPTADAPRVEPGIVEFALIPALAVDVYGFRIGYGGGYYDRLIPSLVHASTCAVAFDFQLVAEVPAFSFDVAVDWVVTDTRTVHAKAERDADA
jgi:5-formyltetrahydrofolate cyclo-ligase